MFIGHIYKGNRKEHIDTEHNLPQLPVNDKILLADHAMHALVACWDKYRKMVGNYLWIIPKSGLNAPSMFSFLLLLG